jgi:ubiquinone/menaquinone biosynthesis C-methylase UbiE
MPSADEIRAAQKQTWDKFSAGWEKWDDVVMATNGPVGTALIESLGIADDQRHLDVAAGTGEPGLTIAGLAPNGRVTLTDLSGEMLAAAQRRAAAKGLANVEYRECGAEDLPFPDASFDSVTCRFAFMFIPDIDRSVAEFARVVKPGGRVAVAVWAGPEVNQWATVAGAAMATEIEPAPPDPDAPGMFRCAAPDAISARFRGAGLHDVTEWDVPTVLETDSPEQYWKLVTELTAGVVAALATVDQATRDRIGARAVEAARAYESDGKTRLPGMARCIAGTK